MDAVVVSPRLAQASRSVLTLSRCAQFDSQTKKGDALFAAAESAIFELARKTLQAGGKGKATATLQELAATGIHRDNLHSILSAIEGWVEYILEVYEVTTHDVNAPPSALSTYQPLLTEKGERAKALVSPTLPSVQDPDNEGDESPLLDAHASLYSAQRPWTAV